MRIGGRFLHLRSALSPPPARRPPVPGIAVDLQPKSFREQCLKHFRYPIRRAAIGNLRLNVVHRSLYPLRSRHLIRFQPVCGTDQPEQRGSSDIDPRGVDLCADVSGPRSHGGHIQRGRGPYGCDFKCRLSKGRTRSEQQAETFIDRGRHNSVSSPRACRRCR